MSPSRVVTQTSGPIFIRSFEDSIDYQGGLYNPVDPITSTVNDALGIGVSIDQVPGYGEFTTLFDRYKILSVKVQFTYMGAYGLDYDAPAPAPLVPYDHTPPPTLYIMRDYDDTNTIPAAQWQEHRYTTWSPSRGGKRSRWFNLPTYARRPLTGISSSHTGTTPVKSPWIDLAFTDVNHGALKIGSRVLNGTYHKFVRRFVVSVMCAGQR